MIRFHDFGRFELTRLCVCLALLAIAVAGAAATHAADDLPQAINTQNPADVAPTPTDALQRITVPAGFSVTLFAGEPDVRQPLAFCHDDRGRLWVVENYSYPEWQVENADRILIFEDTDNDGRFDHRKVFFDAGNHLTGIELGLGGVWCTAAPYLIFIPDENRDDRPDGPPQILLDGFNIAEVQHNVANGLRWGPDGWLYGRHGIKATSHVGRPGATPENRTTLSCSIWRYHPQRKTFEVVSRGTTNPWGFDYNDVGEMFFTNNVNGHLWHVIPGANFQRMHGAHGNPYLYQLMQMCADHFHWAGDDWTDTRKRKGEPNKHDEYGGGHSHCGGMIYLGDNWPAEYRGRMFTCNTHGKRVNQSRLERNGAGYVGRRAPDFLKANSDWFRGVELKYGPDGGVFVTDWTDLGECHDRDGIHRTSGRIYKVIYGEPVSLAAFDLQSLSDSALVEYQRHANDWYVRHARRILWERALAGRDMQATHADLRAMFEQDEDITRKLRALWALWMAGGADSTWLTELLSHDNEHVRVWAIRLLVDAENVDAGVVTRFADLARNDTSAIVRLYLASALQRLPVQQRWPIATALAGRGEDADDKDIPLMVWYGIEPAVIGDPQAAVEMIEQLQFPILREFVARRLTVESDKHSAGLRALVDLLGNCSDVDIQVAVLRGIHESLRGRLRVAGPPAWPEVRKALMAAKRDEVRELARAVSVVFGDGAALEELLRIALQKSAPGPVRQRAITTLAGVRYADLANHLPALVNDRSVRSVAISALSAFENAQTSTVLLKLYNRLDRPDKQASLDVLVSRPQYAQDLIQALEAKTLPASDLAASQARQIHAFNDAAISRRLEAVWGSIRATPVEKRATIDRYKKLLTAADKSNVDLQNGRLLFRKRCAQCHKLFDEGGKIAPNLTGSGRSNLDYLLQNIIDPSAVVAADHRLSVIVLDDGRVLTGTVQTLSDQTVAIQTTKDRIVIETNRIDELRATALSLMPDGLLNELTDSEVRDLFGYLGSPGQIALPTVGN